MTESLQPLLDWISRHPNWAGMLVFLVSLGESLALLGLLVPGAVLLFGVGALVATGSMELGPTLAWAFAGAVIGDGLSFWLGRHYQQRLRVIWPMRNYPRLVNRGVDFFYRHGGKSIALGRFVGPLRPIVPAVAGMLNMPVPRYLAINIVSALLWAPAYILPGVVFGASMGLASEVAGRLVALIGVVIGVIGLSLLLVQRVFRWLQPHADEYLSRLLAWGTRHPRLGELSAAVADPRHPETRGLFILALMLLGSAWLFFGILHTVIGLGGPGSLDQSVYQLLQELRTPWADRLMVGLTELGDFEVYLPVTLALSVWLLARRHIHAALHLLAAVGFTMLLSHGLKLMLAVPRPEAAAGLLNDFSFPSGHTTINAALYAFCSVLIAREMQPERRWIPYMTAVIFVIPIGFSRLYLGMHWLSDVLGGLALGLAWAALIGIAYRRHRPASISVRTTLSVLLTTIVVAATWHLSSVHRSDVIAYTPRHSVQTLGGAHWWQDGWRELPAWRVDLRGRRGQPMNLQWTGSLDTIRASLRTYGWHAPEPFTLKNSLSWLNPDPTLATLPILPQIHDGREPALTLLHPDSDTSHQLVLRLWLSSVALAETGQPVWIGYIAPQQLTRPVPLLAFVQTRDSDDTLLDMLIPALPTGQWRRVTRPLTGNETIYGEVLLARWGK